MSALPPEEDDIGNVPEEDDIGNVSNVKVVNTDTGIIPLYQKLLRHIRVNSLNSDKDVTILTIGEAENELLIQKIKRITPVVYLKTLRKILVDIRKYLTFESPRSFTSKREKIVVINSFIQSIDATGGVMTPANIVLLIESYLEGLNTLDGLEGGKRRRTKYNRKHKYKRSTKLKRNRKYSRKPSRSRK